VASSAVVKCRSYVVRRAGLLVAVLVAVLAVGSAAGAAATPAAVTPAAVTPAADPKPITVATKPIEPFVTDNPAGRPEGFSIDLFDEVARRAGYLPTYTMLGTVTDVLAAVQDGRAQAGVAAISITAEREKQVDFTAPMLQAGLQLAARPTGSETGLGQVVGALVSSTAAKFIALLAVVMVVAGLAMFFADRLDDDRQYEKISDAIWMAAVNLVTVGYGNRSPKRAVTKLIAVVWMLFGLYAAAQFTAVLSSSLTVQTLRSSISSLDDLPGRKVAVVTGTTSEDFLKAQGLPAVGFPTIDDAARAARDGKVDAIVFDGPVLQYLAANNRLGRLVPVGRRLNPEYYGIAVPNDSALRDELSQALLGMERDGSFQRLFDRWFGTS